jgi:hypothetical protein
VHRFGELQPRATVVSHNFVVNWRNLLEGSDQQSVIAPNRLLSNWVHERQRLAELYGDVAIKRISSRRVVLTSQEVLGKNKRHWFLKVAYAAAFMLCLCCLGFGLANMFSVRGESQALQSARDADGAGERASPAKSIKCQAPNLIGVQFDSLSDIVLPPWQFSPSSQVIELGNVESFALEANCEDRRVSYQITASKTSNHWQIKKMAPIE